MTTNARNSLSHFGGMIFGKIDERLSGFAHLEVAKTVRPRGHSDGEIESEPRFAELRHAADESNGGSRPESLDEPTIRAGGLAKIRGAHDRQRFEVGLGTHSITSRAINLAPTQRQLKLLRLVRLSSMR
jgi:hypothetical protein